MYSLDEAVAALRAGAYNKADDILGSLGGEKSGAPARVRVLWAVAQMLCRKFGDGMDAILEVARRNRASPEPIYFRVLSAIGPLEEVLSSAAAQEVRLRTGDYFIREEKPEEATLWLSAALAADPDDPLAIYLEANSRFARYGEQQAVRDMAAVLDRAAAETSRAYFVAGGTAALWHRLGMAHDRMKNPEMAALYLADAVALDPQNDSQRLLLGDVLIRLDRFAEAIEYLAPIQKFADAYRYAARLRAVALYRLGETEEALALLEEVSRIDPLAALTFLELGRVYLARGDLERAEVALARAFRTNPDLPELKSAITALERDLGRHMDADAGLPPPTAFAIPAEFAPRSDDPALGRLPSLAEGVVAHFRVLRTLMLRDVFVRYAHSGMGYLWAFAHPLVYVITLWVLFFALGHTAPDGIPTVDFLITGIVPFICFYVRIETAVSSAIAGNSNLLYFRGVTPLALIIANWLREFLTSLITFSLVVGGLALYRGSLRINDPLQLLVALTCIGLVGMVIGALFGMGRLVMPQLELAQPIIFRIMFFFSGCLFLGNSMPPQLRRWALFNPLLHLIEFVRDSYLTSYHSRYADWHYPLEFIGLGLVLMLVVLHAGRRHMVAS